MDLSSALLGRKWLSCESCGTIGPWVLRQGISCCEGCGSPSVLRVVRQLGEVILVVSRLVQSTASRVNCVVKPCDERYQRISAGLNRLG